MKFRLTIRREIFYISLILSLSMIIMITGHVASAVYNTNHERATNHLKSINYQNERSIARYFSLLRVQLGLLVEDSDFIDASYKTDTYEIVRAKLLNYEIFHPFIFTAM